MTDIATRPLIRHPDRLFVGGEWIQPSSAATLAVIDSHSEEVFLTVAEADAADVERAVAAARRAFDAGPWPRLTHAARADWLRRIAEGLRARAPDVAHAWTVESGMVHSVSSVAAVRVASVYDYYAGLAETYPFVERHAPGAGGEHGFLLREPVGVVAAIIPWNGTPMITAYKVAPALLAGCTVIIKASPEAPGTPYILAEVCEAIGLPAGVINVLAAERETSELLVGHPGIDKVSFTGSTAAGRRVAALCGERIARCTLELGGKSAAVVLDDYDIDVAARTIAGKAVFLTGQVCSSLTRIIVPRRRHDAMVEALAARFEAVRVGDPFTDVDMGPLAMKRQRARVEEYVAKGIAEGARLATGGGRPANLSRGYYIEPTVFGSVGNDFTIAREEIFGPVLSVIPAETEEEAIAIANDTIYGLNASIFTTDADRAFAAARALRSGTVGHNSFREDLTIAFGGFKQSGIGREGGTEGLAPYLETKTVILDTLPKAI